MDDQHDVVSGYRFSEKIKDINTLVGAQLCNFLYTSLNKRIKVPFLVILSK